MELHGYNISEDSGVGLIAKERLEQIYKHGFDELNDSYYGNDELEQAALYCLTEIGTYWPCNWDYEWKNKIDKKSTEEKRIVAGAFLAAQIDRDKSKEIKK